MLCHFCCGVKGKGSGRWRDCWERRGSPAHRPGVSAISIFLRSKRPIFSKVKRRSRWLSGKEQACQCRRHKSHGLILGSERSPGRGNGNLLLYSYLKNSMDRGAWQATAHRVTKSWTRLNNWANTHTYTRKKKKAVFSVLHRIHEVIHWIGGCLAWELPLRVCYKEIFSFYWSVVDLQCCLHFSCTAKWFSYTYIYVLFVIFFSSMVITGY